MHRKCVLPMIIAALSLLLAASAEAKPVKTTVAISQPVMLGEKQLAPGDYRVEADDSRVIIRRGREVVAEMPANWRDLETPARNSGLVLREGRIVEIRFGGRSRALAVG
jgi:hypothetical protein